MLPDKIYPVEFGGFWEFASDYTYQGTPFLDVDKYPEAQEFAYECAKRYNQHDILKMTLSNALTQIQYMREEFESRELDCESSEQAIRTIEKVLGYDNH